MRNSKWGTIFFTSLLDRCLSTGKYKIVQPHLAEGGQGRLIRYLELYRYGGSLSFRIAEEITLEVTGS